MGREIRTFCSSKSEYGRKFLPFFPIYPWQCIILYNVQKGMQKHEDSTEVPLVPNPKTRHIAPVDSPTITIEFYKMLLLRNGGTAHCYCKEELQERVISQPAPQDVGEFVGNEDRALSWESCHLNQSVLFSTPSQLQ
jgi:hypothetical protein